MRPTLLRSAKRSRARRCARRQPKSLQQQSELLVHRARQGFVQQRTATINRIRGLLSEFGVVLPLKASSAREALHRLEDLPGWANTVVGDLLSEVSRLDARIAQYDRHIEQIAKASAPARQLMQLPWRGRHHRNRAGGHDRPRPRVQVRPTAVGVVWAWCRARVLSGGKQRLGRITKAGDPYLRMLLILGARSVLQSAKDKTDPVSRWAVQLAARVGYWKAIVAIAAKNARMCWAVLSRGEAFRLPA